MNGVAIVAGLAGTIAVGAVLLLLISRARVGWDRWTRLSFLVFLSSLFVFLIGVGFVADVQLTVPIIVMGACPLFIIAYKIRKMPRDATLKIGSWHLRASGVAAGIAMVSGGVILRIGLEELGFGPLALVGFGVLAVFLSLTSSRAEEHKTPIA